MALIPITVIGGYLGAGKTTLVNRLLAEAGGRRLGVVVNDFGELGVDAALLADAGADGLVDLPNGCVCCTLGTELGEALEALAARRPVLDQILIEASGVADPATLAAWGTVPGFSPGGVVVLAAADAVRRQVDDRYVGGEVRRQLLAADVVVATRSDLVTGGDLVDVVDWLDRTVDAPVVVGDERTVALVLTDLPSGSEEVSIRPVAIPGAGPRAGDRAGPGADAGDGDGDDAGDGAGAVHTDVHADVHANWTWTPPSGEVVDEAGLRRFVEELPWWVSRAKGIVPVGRDDDDRSAAPTGALVQVVGSRREIRPVAAAGEVLGLVVIGPTAAFDRERLDDLAALHLTARPAL